MMKKLLILMLVLGMTSVANADILTDIELWYDGTTVTVVGLNAVEYTNYIGIYDEAAQGTVGPPYEMLPAAGGLAAMTGRPAGYNGVDVATQSNTLVEPPLLVEVGDWFRFGFAGGEVGDTMTIYDYAISYVDPVGTLNLIPEPMTIALLGLGGLFLLRRRK